MTLTEFLKENPEYGDLHILLDNGKLTVLPSGEIQSAEEPTVENESTLFDFKFFAGPAGM